MSSRSKWVFSILSAAGGMLALAVVWRWRVRTMPAMPVTIDEPTSVPLPPPTLPEAEQVANRSTGAARWIVMAVACGFMVFSAVNFYPFVPENEWAAALAAVVGGALVVIAGRRPSAETVLKPAVVPKRLNVFHAVIFFAGIVGILLVSESNGNLMAIGWLQQMHYHVQFILWCVSLCLLVWGVSGVRWWKLLWQTRQWSKTHQREITVVALITLVALALRTWRLEDAVRLFLDEGHFGDGVRYFWAAGDTKLFKPMSTVIAFPMLYSYFQTFTVSLFGRTLVGLRAVSVMIGTLSIPAVYLFARQFFDRRVAWIAALLLAVYPPHLQFSRMGINNIADTLFGVLALVFLARGLNSGRRLDYALAGIGLGLTQYFYEGGRLLYPPLIVVWLLGIWVLRRGWKTFRRDIAIGLVTMGCVAVIVAVPVYYTFYGLKFPAAARFQIASIFSSDNGWVAPEVNNLVNELQVRLHGSLQFYVSIPEAESPRHYGGETPLVLVYLVPALLLGVGYALGEFRSRGQLLILLWVLLTSLGNTLMQWSNLSARYVVVFPALMVLAALGISRTVDILVPRWKNAAAFGLVAMLGVVQVGYYFGPHLELYNQQLRPNYDSTDAMFRSVNFPRGTQIYLISDPTIDGSYTTQVMQFLMDGTDLHVLDHLTPDYLNTLSRAVDQAFFISPHDDASLKLLESEFILEGPSLSPYDVPHNTEFVLYYAHCSQGCTLPALQGH